MFPHQSYRRRVLKTPAVPGAFGDATKKRWKLFSCRVFLPKKKTFHLLCETQRNSSQMISIFLFVVYDGSLLECHDAFENNLMMVCHWTRILLQQEDLQISATPHFPWIFKLMPKCLLRVLRKKMALLRVKRGFSFVIDADFYVWQLSINKSVYSRVVAPIYTSKISWMEGLMPLAHRHDLLNSLTLPRADLC